MTPSTPSRGTNSEEVNVTPLRKNLSPKHLKDKVASKAENSTGNGYSEGDICSGSNILKNLVSLATACGEAPIGLSSQAIFLRDHMSIPPSQSLLDQVESIDESIDENVIQIPDKCEIDLEGIQVPIVEVVFPRLGSKMTSGHIKWEHIVKHEKVTKGQKILVAKNEDKSVYLDIESEIDGYLAAKMVTENKLVAVDSVLGILVEKEEHIVPVESHIFLQIAKFEEAERIRLEEERQRLEQERLEEEKKRAEEEEKRKQEIERKAEVQRKLNDVINESQHLLNDMKVEEEKQAEVTSQEQKLDISENEIEIFINEKSEDNPDETLEVEKENDGNDNENTNAPAQAVHGDDETLETGKENGSNDCVKIDASTQAVHEDDKILQQSPEECSKSGEQQSPPESAENTEKHITESDMSVEKTWKALKADSKSVFIKLIMEGYSLTNEQCEGNFCESQALLSNNNICYCVVCGGTGSGADGAYINVTQKSIHVPKDSPRPEEVAKLIGERALSGW
eukprot:CAMPEP_0116021408 /NCGR_PEP_ID=MMETSP0321-20121206/10370_1 /TAXON_ID=163516 /ORGANISM="Leptocylindrus danicus var. danicus, Strain B650" /LENGTH=509 /DNA_ID=CAMNT_0003492275 /DNA_START=82 /DNA_END=1608 /DNA_ORIENTATION=+